MYAMISKNKTLKSSEEIVAYQLLEAYKLSLKIIYGLVHLKCGHEPALY